MHPFINRVDYCLMTEHDLDWLYFRAFERIAMELLGWPSERFFTWR